MAPESHFNNPFFPNDRSLAAQIVEASKAEQNHVAVPKPKKQKKMEADAASVSSFGSSIGLLRKKLHRPSSSSSPAEKKAPASMQKNILRNQVNIVG